MTYKELLEHQSNESVVVENKMEKLYNQLVFNQLVLVEFRNCSPFLYKMVSDKPITLDKVVQHFIDTEGFNDQRDSITFVDEMNEIPI